MSDQVTAREVAERIAAEWLCVPTLEPKRVVNRALADRIEAALAAAVAGERERIAVMVENMNHYEFESYCDNCHSTTIHPQTAADAIRSPETAQAGDATEKENEHG